MKKYSKLANFVVLAMVANLMVLPAMGVGDSIHAFGLWHMEEAADVYDQYNHLRSGILDDDSIYQGRNNELILGQKRSAEDITQRPAIVEGLSGNALEFDGINDMAHTLKPWSNSSNFEIEFDLNVITAPESSAHLVMSPSSFIVYLQKHTNGELSVIARIYEDGSYAGHIAQSQMFDINTWHNIKVVVRSGEINVLLDGQDGLVSGTYSAVDPAYASLPYVNIGADHYANHPFNGKIDELIIYDYDQAVPDYLMPYQDSLMTRCLLHLDELGTSGPIKTPDENSSGRESNDGLIIPLNYDPEEYTGPSLVHSFDADSSDPNILGNFGNCMYFDGTNHAIRLTESTTDDLGVIDNVRIECFAKLDVPTKENNNRTYTLFYQANRFSIVIQDRSDGVWVLEYRIWNQSNTLKKVVLGNPTDLSDWNHYALEFLDGRLEAFLNGQSVGVVENCGLLGDAIRHWHISGDHNADRRWKGWIDEYRVSLLSGQCGDLGYSPADFNQDCYVDDLDLIMFAEEWLMNPVN